MEQKQWYVVNTYAGHENRVKDNLEKRLETMGISDNLFRIVVAEETQIEVKNEKSKEVVRIYLDYVSQEDLQITLEDYNELIEEKLANMDMTPYVETTEFQQTKDALTASISRGGGSNMIKNSVKYNFYIFLMTVTNKFFQIIVITKS